MWLATVWSLAWLPEVKKRLIWRSLMQLNNQVALITGGASGLGLATAKSLQSQGLRIAVLDYDQASLERVSLEHGFVTHACDVADAQAVELACQKVVKEYGAIHINVNCAGIAPAARVVSREGVQPLSAFEKVIQVNLLGTFNVLRVVAGMMMQQDPVDNSDERGVIINTASVAAFDGQIGQAAYSASKGGVAAMTLPIAREFSKQGIRVMTIAPGIMQTPMMAAMPEKVQASLHATVPFPARMGLPEEYASLVRHIIENAYLNGEVIRLDGAIRMAMR